MQPPNPRVVLFLHSGLARASSRPLYKGRGGRSRQLAAWDTVHRMSVKSRGQWGECKISSAFCQAGPLSNPGAQRFDVDPGFNTSLLPLPRKNGLLYETPQRLLANDARLIMDWSGQKACSREGVLVQADPSLSGWSCMI